MRRLLPSSADELTDDDLLDSYAYPDEPWLRANMVAALDGVATVHGLSAGLSGPVDKRAFGVMRALADVVMAGAGTARTEDYGAARVPSRFMDLRVEHGQAPEPRVALVSRHLGLDPNARLFAETTERPIVYTCATSSEERRRALDDVAEVLVIGEREVDLAAVRADLEGRDLKRMLCEGGPSLLQTMIEADVVDEICLTVSPRLVGGGERRILFGDALREPRTVRLAGLLEQDGVLLSRYLLDAATDPDPEDA